MNADVNKLADNEDNNVVQPYPEATIKKQDLTAKWLIWIFSIVIFLTVTALGNIQLNVDLGFNPHVFAKINAYINATVALLLVAGLIAVKRGNYLQHKRFMIAALVLSIIFLLSYVAHHLLTGSTHFGGSRGLRYIYLIILVTHIFLAAVILPFILFTTYRALIAEWAGHKRLAKITWPIWFYVSVTGVVVYLMISPYYS